MKKRYIAGILILTAVLLGAVSCVPYGVPGQQPYNYGPGGWIGPGMMGPGMGPGMMGGGWGNWGNYNPLSQPITIDQAADAARRYISAYSGRLILTEVMDFAQNFYAEVEEKDTGIHAMELLVDKYTGWVYPEMGPNMMWNSKYGMMGRMFGSQYSQAIPTMPVSAAQAQTLAQQYLDANFSGLTAAEAETFYGYYTLHTLKDGRIEGMLSVNGYTGAVWYHTWHGQFIGIKEFD